eukprot:7171070-Pyramimonas_sp.AAC.1
MMLAVGSRGFDPLRLGGNPTLLPYFQQAELTNGRWAMMAVAGCMFTDAMGLPKWWLAGAEASQGPGLAVLIAVEVRYSAVCLPPGLSV